MSHKTSKLPTSEVNNVSTSLTAMLHPRSEMSHHFSGDRLTLTLFGHQLGLEPPTFPRHWAATAVGTPVTFLLLHTAPTPLGKFGLWLFILFFSKAKSGNKTQRRKQHKRAEQETGLLNPSGLHSLRSQSKCWLTACNRMTSDPSKEPFSPLLTTQTKNSELDSWESLSVSSQFK